MTISLRPPRMIRLAVPMALALCSAMAPAGAQGQQWFRGNTHTHTANSDGDSPPDSVVRWYREADYDFLFITDHERITDVGPLNARWGAPGRFLVLAGEEVTQFVADAGHPDGRRQAHVNGLGLRQVVVRLGDRGIAENVSMQDAYARNIAEIRRAGGIAQVNHPNFRWSVRLQDLMALPDSTLFEIWNAHTGVNNLGGVDSTGRAIPSAEALWDSLLTSGKVVFGVADDDSHSFRPDASDSYKLTRPGRAWIMARADTLTGAAILDAIRRGDFYASTGVTLRELTATEAAVTVAVAPVYDSRYTIEFIGAGGRVLATVHGPRADYVVRGSEGYIRVRITDSNGRKAWTQAIRQQRGDWASLSRYRAANDSLPLPVAGENRVVYIGDSITESWAPYFPALFPRKPYIGRGISGQTTPQILLRFRQDVVSLRPNVVVILAGTNDIAGNTGPSSVVMIADNLRSMAEIARANGIRVVLSSVLPVDDYPWKRGLNPAPTISALNAWIRSYAEETGAVYLDYHSAMVDSRGGLRAQLTADGVHPNATGYQLMASLAEAAVAKALR
ncbi:MAG: GDSL-type esterase/lipase family protein [Gemmatimonadaceae bacterium]